VLAGFSFVDSAFAEHRNKPNSGGYVFDCSGNGGGNFGRWAEFRNWVQDNNGAYHACGYNWINQCFDGNGERTKECNDSSFGQIIHQFDQDRPAGWQFVVNQFEQELSGFKPLDNQRNTKLIFRGHSFGGGTATMIGTTSFPRDISLIDFIWLMDPVGPSGARRTLVNDCGIHENDVCGFTFGPRDFHAHVKRVLFQHQEQGAPPGDINIGNPWKFRSPQVEDVLVTCSTLDASTCHFKMDSFDSVFDRGLEILNSMNKRPIWETGFPNPSSIVIDEGENISVELTAVDGKARNLGAKTGFTHVQDYEENTGIMNLRLVLLSLYVPSPNQNSLIDNGSFENDCTINGPNVNECRYSGHVRRLQTGNTDLDSWDIKGSVDHVGTSWLASHGKMSLDMSGIADTAPNSISQTFPTQIGKNYFVSFELGANPLCGLVPNPKTLVAKAGDAEVTFNRSTGSVVIWQSKNFIFEATDATTTLEFSSPDNSGCGPTLDNVVVIDTLSQPFYTFLDQGRKGPVGGSTEYIAREGSLDLFSVDSFSGNLIMQVYDNGFPCNKCRGDNSHLAQGATGLWKNILIPVIINNLPPVPSISVDSENNFLFSATDPSALDEAAGFAYEVDWGDGNDVQSFGQASGNLIQNGSFEDGNHPGTFTTLNVGATNLKPWNITSGTVDHIQDSWFGSAGFRSLDMSGASGTESNTIIQEFDTENEKSYFVSFEMGANPHCGSVPDPKNLVAKAGDAKVTFTAPVNGGVKWQSKNFIFMATSDRTTLEFSSPDNSGCGPALDNVVVTLVPDLHLDLEPQPHSYNAPGNYTVTLTAIDKDGGVSAPVSLNYASTVASPPQAPPGDAPPVDQPTPPGDVLTEPELSIPDWVKDNAKWWSERAVSDSDFTRGISYMIDEDIISIPDLPETTQAAEENVPEWVRNMAGWWAHDQTSDREFADAIKFLVEKGIIHVET